MTPSDYCSKWVPILYNLNPGDRGYRAACNREISKVTGVSSNTVSQWGKDLENYHPLIEIILAYRDKLNNIQMAIGILPDFTPDSKD